MPSHRPRAGDRPLAIRRAEPADAPRLTAIAHAAKRHWGYADELIALWSADLTLTPATIAEDAVHCAILDGTIVGLHAVSLDAASASAELEHLWVDPPYLGGGVGAALLAHARDTARAAGATVLWIASDPNAEGFYLRMGATRVGERLASPAGRTLPLLALRLDPETR